MCILLLITDWCVLYLYTHMYDMEIKIDTSKIFAVTYNA